MKKNIIILMGFNLILHLLVLVVWFNLINFVSSSSFLDAHFLFFLGVLSILRMIQFSIFSLLLFFSSLNLLNLPVLQSSNLLVNLNALVFLKKRGLNLFLLMKSVSVLIGML